MARSLKPALFLFFLIAWTPQEASAHELGIARVALAPEAGGDLTVTAWLPPFETESAPALPEFCRLIDSSVRPAPQSGVRAEWRFACDGAFRAGDLMRVQWPIEGIFLASGSASDTADGQFFDAEEGLIEVPLHDVLAGETALSAFPRYVALGVEHILSGWDHLVFVLLLCLIANGWQLVKLVTAFTIGHSITLAAAVLGLIDAPGPPVEATIALSIIIVAREAIVTRTSRTSYLIVMAFGLLHGLGFAGALREAGFSSTGLVSSLLGFNIGVELGQLFFVAVVVAIAAAGRKMALELQVRPLLAYATGALGFFWLLDRTVGFYL